MWRRILFNKRSAFRELIYEQLPLSALVLGIGYLFLYFEAQKIHTYNVYFPIAGVYVSVWHLLSLGFFSGYTMGLLGSAAGLFTLPYAITVLGFTNASVAPTNLLITSVNPLGALLGFWRGKQWNGDLAMWVCLGAATGGLAGPVMRTFLLSDFKQFKLALGLVLSVAGLHLLYIAMLGLRESRWRIPGLGHAHAGAGRSIGPDTVVNLLRAPEIDTVFRDRSTIKIRYEGEVWSFNLSFLFLLSSTIGAISSALGLGGGFLLVPVLVMVYKLPIHVLVSVTIPYVIVLSLFGLISYQLLLPFILETAAYPEWSWGLFVASGGILGSWAASKTQRKFPEYWLKLVLGSITAVVGLCYVLFTI